MTSKISPYVTSDTFPNSFAFSSQPLVKPDLEKRKKCLFLYGNSSLRAMSVSRTARSTFSLSHPIKPAQLIHQIPNDHIGDVENNELFQVRLHSS